MKLTKQLETEIKKFMKTYWDTYLKGDLKTWASFLPTDYKNIGGTEEEIWDSKKEILDYTKRIINQMVGQAEIRNTKYQIFPYDPYMMVHEFTDMFIKVDKKWTFYGKFRLSSIIQKTAGGWKVLHQHGSYPDSKTSEGEAFAFDTLKSENIKLQKAVKDRTAELEEKNRELEIETALERVRAKTMAMHKTSELQEVIHTVHQELLKLNIGINGGSFIAINSEIDKELHCWGAGGTADTSQEVHVPYYSKPFYTNLVKRIKKAPSFFTEEYSQKEKKEFFTFLFKHEPWSKLKAKEKKETLSSPGSYIRSCCVSKHTSIFIINHFGEKFSEEENEILKRFGKVFEQTYTRFLDLQKAEAQVREAQIEAALERTRTQSMIMQHSKELDDTLRVFHEQVLLLGIKSAFSFLWLPDENKDRHIFWAAWAENEPDVFKSKAIDYPLDRNEPATAQCLIDWKADEPVVSYHVPPAGVKNYFAAWQELIEGVEQLKPEYFNGGLYYVEAFMKYGCFGVMVESELSHEERNILCRLAVEFERTYTRFLDLQKAEAQAMESHVQLSMERVRARTMAMQKSEELPDAANILFHQVQSLGIPAWSAGYCIWDEEHQALTLWMSSSGIIQKPFRATVTEDPSFIRFYEAWKRNEAFYVEEIGGKELASHYKYMCQLPVVGEMLNKFVDEGGALPVFQIFHLAFFKQGFLLFITYEPVPDAHNIFKRLGKVFEQTYTRFLDLQKAEAQGREAQIETGLERVRSRTLAMQKSDELAETSVVVFQELLKLGIEPNRLFIGIMKDDISEIEAWATNEDGSKIGNHFTLSAERNASVKKMYDGWKDKKSALTIDMAGEELQNYFHYLADEMQIPFKGGLSQKRRVQTIAYFSQGLIGMASPDEQPEATLHLLERFAAVFNLTYTRFNDLKIAEAHAIQAEEDLVKLQTEKKRAEDALDELQATQKQLVQSEKMASLGELTAGIAHEIQNPLNFVNNFSEVSNELLDEMMEAAGKGDFEEVKEILNDVKQNLKKINHHGKRADGIVKGMLQHSRSSSGTKEPTDINALADEYLRLAYHGLRAKDKSFNATMKTEYEEGLEKVNVIPQDIGRVVLNLITNAFYVVNEKKKSGIENYEPTVEVSTKKIADKVLISVKDNGNGIPQKVFDKIFQPFFTTKPTGQGTGLGLSLSYDIVKVHNGELKVDTKEGEGSVFIIQLPIK